MPTTHRCVNDRCPNYTRHPFTLCDDCKEQARQLQHEIEIEDKPQFLSKNEGLRRHHKPFRKAK